VLLAACIGGFVASGVHPGARGVQPAPASVSEPLSRTTYYIDATIGGKGSGGKCITEGVNPRVKTVPCRLSAHAPLTGRKP
jgi:hypothetical protein